MSKLENLNQLDEKIYSVLSLLKVVNFKRIGTVLTDEERNKLLKFNFKHGKFNYNLSFIIEDLNYPEYVDRINKYLFDSLTPDVLEIIEKCGVDPHKVFVFTDTNPLESNVRIDPKLYSAMHGNSCASCDDFFIVRFFDFPTNDDIDYTIKLGRYSFNSFPLNINSNNSVSYHGKVRHAGYPFSNDFEKITDYQELFDCLLNVEEALRREIDIKLKPKPNKVRLLDKFRRLFKRGL